MLEVRTAVLYAFVFPDRRLAEETLSEDSLLLLVADNGHGVQAISIPDVALKRGYTTTISLGMGYMAMISIAGQVYFTTGADGTTVAVEMKLDPVVESPAEIAPSDTW